MPVEIKELLVQAKLQEEAKAATANGGKAPDQEDADDDDCSGTDRTEEIVEACLERVKSWLKEQQLR